MPDDKDDEYISGEQHAAQRAHKKSRGTFTITKPVAMVIAAVILVIISFYGGVQYQKGRHPVTTTTTASSAGAPSTSFGQGGGGRFRGGQRPTFGSVTAISSTSITVDNQSGTSVTFAITSSTTITDSGQTTTTSDISTGETVAVIASTTDSTQAARILVNPSFGGGGNAPTSTPDNSSTTPTVTD
jgi:hypothetical protein